MNLLSLENLTLEDLRSLNSTELLELEYKIKNSKKESKEVYYKYLEKLKKYNEKMLKKIAELPIDFVKILYFLKIIYNDNISFDFRIEIRCLPIKKEDKIKSIDLYGFGIENQKKLLNLFKKINIKEYNIYYSLYKFQLTDIKRRRINNANSRCTSVLAWDFDKIDEDEMNRLYEICSSKKVFPMVVNSGFGYHFLFQLGADYYDTNLLKLFNELGQTLGLNVDPAIKDSARILRLPYTYNCKKVLDDNNNINHNRAIPCVIVKNSCNILSAENLFEKLGGNYKHIIPAPIVILKSKFEYKLPKNNYDYKYIQLLKESVQATYSNCLRHIDLPSNILTMLNTGGIEGCRNEAIMYLIYFFRNYLTYNKSELKNIIFKWNRKNSFDSLDEEELNKDFERLYKKNYGCEYSNKLQEYYGKKDKKSYEAIRELVKNVNTHTIVIPNKLFLKMDRMKHTSARVFLSYLAEKRKYTLNGKHYEYMLKDDLINLCNISSRTLDRCLFELKKYQLISTNSLPYPQIEHLKAEGKKINRNTKVVTIHKSILNSKLNYTNLDKNVLKMALNELDNISLILYVYTYSQLKRLDSNFDLAQVTIGKKLNMAQSTVSLGYKKLVDMKYLEKLNSTFLDIAYKKADIIFKQVKNVQKKLKPKNIVLKKIDDNPLNTISLDLD